MSGEDDLRPKPAYCKCAPTPAEPARESDEVRLRGALRSDEVNAIQDSSGAPGRLTRKHFEAVERIIAARVAEAGERALEEAAKWMDSDEFVRPEDSAYINESHWNDSIADAVAVLYDRAYRLRGQR